MPPPLYESLPTDDAAHHLIQPAWQKRHRRTLTWTAVGAVAFFLLIAIASFRGSPQPKKLHWAPATHADAGKRVYLRVGALGVEGFGSALQHFKQSIVLSRALNATLLLAAEQSEHQYSTSAIYNGVRDAAALDVHNACRVKDHLPSARRNELVRGWCAGDAAAVAEMDRIVAEMADCTGILDMDEHETTEDLNGCITAWVRERLAPAAPPARLPPLTVPPTRPVTVGIHIRWGDAASAAHAAPASSVPTHFRGSMNTPALRRILADLRASPLGAHGLRLTVAMEHADARVLAALGEPDYTLLDSRGGAGGALADLHALGNQDVLLLGESSWGVLVHLVAPPGLTIVEFSGGNKYVNATGFGRDVVFLEGYTPEVLAAGWPRVDVP
ncbi:hypothetical protein B0H15DRAFT_296589 [Mycena belliarum]|uniref:Uncharacterized protein n=1 Tax=Mycena belliarum TaxID=1033014 RepID=A0AAD6XNY2_9AGAR|nr:hypothetical protein B0H15DRAFT_296589 [Mycena belliae]